MIIGKGGETIKRLAAETGAKIQFKPDGNGLESYRLNRFFLQKTRMLLRIVVP